MARAKNRFLLSALVIGSFLVYTLGQGLSRIYGALAGSTGSDPALASTGSPQPLPVINSGSGVQKNTRTVNNNQISFIPHAPVLASQASAAPVANSGATSRTMPPRKMMAGHNNMNAYQDGSYTGNSADAYYGRVQVQVAVKSGRISNINVLNHPSGSGHTDILNAYAIPILRSEVISAQSANINTVSGATETSRAFIQSLKSALSQA